MRFVGISLHDILFAVQFDRRRTERASLYQSSVTAPFSFLVLASGRTTENQRSNAEREGKEKHRRRRVSH